MSIEVDKDGTPVLKKDNLNEHNINNDKSDTNVIDFKPPVEAIKPVDEPVNNDITKTLDAEKTRTHDAKLTDMKPDIVDRALTEAHGSLINKESVSGNVEIKDTVNEMDNVDKNVLTVLSNRVKLEKINEILKNGGMDTQQREKALLEIKSIVELY